MGKLWTCVHLNKSEHDFTPVPSAGATGQAGQAMLNNCKDEERK